MAVKQFIQARAAAPTGEPPAPSATSIDLALSILREHLEGLHALSTVLEERLASACKREKDNYPPLTEWHLARVMHDMLTSTKVFSEVSHLLGKEVSHG